MPSTVWIFASTTLIPTSRYRSWRYLPVKPFYNTVVIAGCKETGDTQIVRAGFSVLDDPRNRLNSPFLDAGVKPFRVRATPRRPSNTDRLPCPTFVRFRTKRRTFDQIANLSVFLITVVQKFTKYLLRDPYLGCMVFKGASDGRLPRCNWIWVSRAIPIGFRTSQPQCLRVQTHGLPSIYRKAR
jgi:hypothetical protein